MRVLSLTDAEATDSAGKYELGAVAAVRDGTYGALKVVYCYIQTAIALANCGPVYEDVTAGKWYVDDDENESGVIGQEFCCGAFLMAVVNAAAAYGWVLVAGLNPIAMLTDTTLAAGYGVISAANTGSEGVWSATAPTINVALTAGTEYNTDGYVVGVARAADSGTAQAVGTVMFNSVWASMEVTLN